MTGRKPAVEDPIPNRIAELRERTGLSRVELAQQVGVNPQTIGYLERGEYNPSLALAFRLPISSSYRSIRSSCGATNACWTRPDWHRMATTGRLPDSPMALRRLLLDVGGQRRDDAVPPHRGRELWRRRPRAREARSGLVLAIHKLGPLC